LSQNQNIALYWYISACINQYVTVATSRVR